MEHREVMVILMMNPCLYGIAFTRLVGAMHATRGEEYSSVLPISEHTELKLRPQVKHVPGRIVA